MLSGISPMIYAVTSRFSKKISLFFWSSCSGCETTMSYPFKVLVPGEIRFIEVGILETDSGSVMVYISNRSSTWIYIFVTSDLFDSFHLLRRQKINGWMGQFIQNSSIFPRLVLQTNDRLEAPRINGLDFLRSLNAIILILKCFYDSRCIVNY